jgi:phosphoribosylformylglycinamidine synthase
MNAIPSLGWKVDVHVTLKPSVLDPQGATVQRSLHAMGYDQLLDTRLGKYFELTFAAGLTREQVEKQTKEICEKLLANPVIERFRFAIAPQS